MIKDDNKRSIRDEETLNYKCNTLVADKNSKSQAFFFFWENTIAARDLEHRRRRGMTTTGSDLDYLNATAHASLVVHILSRTWKPLVCRPAVNDLKWSDKHDVVLCREALIMVLFEHPYGSKKIGDVVWWDFSCNNNSCRRPKYFSLCLPKRSNLEAIAGTWYVAVLETKKLKTFVEVVPVYGTLYPSSWPYSVDKDPRRILQMTVFIC